jgi:mannose-1-phosphate guanylyltransferase
MTKVHSRLQAHSNEKRNPQREPGVDGWGKQPAQIPGLWSIVLAGGEGVRVRPFIQGWLGRTLPKQYCIFVGTRSLLQHTLDRALRLTPTDRTLVVIDQTHRQFVEPRLPPVHLILQPRNCETAPGIFLPLAYIRRYDPHANVIIYPSDHFVFPESRYVEILQEIVEEDSSLERLILLGVEPDGLELEYGWIQPGSVIAEQGHRVWSVQSFIEKPSLTEAAAAMEHGALWNTFVLVGKVDLLWNLGLSCLPEMMPYFEVLSSAIGSGMESEVLDSIYAGMPVRNFSTEILHRAPENVAVVKLENVIWSDWGSPDRIIRSLRGIHREPALRAASGPARKSGISSVR